MRRGTTLIELLLVLVLLAVCGGMALPAIGSLRDGLLVRESASLLAGAHARARILALAEARIAVLDLAADSLLLRVIEGPADTVERWRTGGPATLGVAGSGLPRRITFAPSGVTFGVANATYTLTRGAATRQVIVSRYGRVRVQ